MAHARKLTYRTLRIVESFGLQGCTAGDFSAKYYARRISGPRRNGSAGRFLGELATAGYLLRIFEGGEAVYHLADAGRIYLSETHSRATEEANARAAARTGTYYGQGMAYGGGNR